MMQIPDTPAASCGQDDDQHELQQCVQCTSAPARSRCGVIAVFVVHCWSGPGALLVKDGRNNNCWNENGLPFEFS
jgi:hypothetical protein